MHARTHAHTNSPPTHTHLQTVVAAPGYGGGAYAMAAAAAAAPVANMRVDIGRGGQAWKEGKGLELVAEDTSAKDHSEEVGVGVRAGGSGGPYPGPTQPCGR